MAKKDTKSVAGVRKAYDVDVSYYTICGLGFLLGLATFVFMVVVCFRSKDPGAMQMLVLLDGVMAIFCVYLLVAWLRHRAIFRRKLGYTKAAVERRENGTVRLEFPVGKQRYFIDIPGEERIDPAGMANVWYDTRDPRKVFVAMKEPKEASPFGVANMGVLITLSAIVNAVFFLILK